MKFLDVLILPRTMITRDFVRIPNKTTRHEQTSPRSMQSRGLLDRFGVQVHTVRPGTVC